MFVSVTIKVLRKCISWQCSRKNISQCNSRHWCQCIYLQDSSNNNCQSHYQEMVPLFPCQAPAKIFVSVTIVNGAKLSYCKAQQQCLSVSQSKMEPIYLLSRLQQQYFSELLSRNGAIISPCESPQQ